MSVPNQTPVQPVSSVVPTPTPTVTATPSAVDEFFAEAFPDESVVNMDEIWEGKVDLRLEPPENGTSYKLGKSTAELINDLPAPHRQLIANMQADHTRKMQKLAAERKELERVRADMLRDRETISKAFPVMPERKLTEEMVWKGEAQLADYVKQELAYDQADRFANIESSWKQEQEIMEMRSFRDSHPEFQDKAFSSKVAEYYKKGLSLEESYFIVKGMTPVIAPEPEKDTYTEWKEKRSKSDTQRSTLNKLGAGARGPREVELKPGMSLGEVRAIREEYIKRTGTEPKLRKLKR